MPIRVTAGTPQQGRSFFAVKHRQKCVPDTPRRRYTEIKPLARAQAREGLAIRWRRIEGAQRLFRQVCIPACAASHRHK